jgi:hypothetical protein
MHNSFLVPSPGGNNTSQQPLPNHRIVISPIAVFAGVQPHVDVQLKELLQLLRRSAVPAGLTHPSPLRLTQLATGHYLIDDISELLR